MELLNIVSTSTNCFDIEIAIRRVNCSIDRSIITNRNIFNRNDLPTIASNLINEICFDIFKILISFLFEVSILFKSDLIIQLLFVVLSLSNNQHINRIRVHVDSQSFIFFSKLIIRKFFNRFTSFSPFSGTLADVALDGHVGFALAQRVALVGVGLADAVGDLQFDEAVPEVHFEGDERSPFCIDGLGEFQNFALVQKQTPGAFDLVVEAVAEAVGGYVDVVEKSLIVLYFNVPFAQLDGPVAAAFDLGPRQLDPRFELIHDGVVVESFLVGCENRVLRR